MAKSQLLELPPELILACLENLPFRDLDACLESGSRLIRDLIRDSVVIRYRRQQLRAGVEENPQLASNLVISDRVVQLQCRETDWQNFSPRSTHGVNLDFETSGLYDLGSDVYFVGGSPDPKTRMCTAIKAIHTSPGAEWHTIDCGKSIVDFGTALEEHDLIAMVTYTLYGQNLRTASVDVVFFKFSTGTAHPLATRHTLHIHDIEVNCGRPTISIEFSGETLALSIVYWGFERRDMDALHLYNWQTGIPKMDPFPICNTGLAFLTPDLLILTNSMDSALDVLRVPSTDNPEPPNFIHSFHLPLLAPSTSIHTFQCRGAPNPRASFSRPGTAPFLARPASALIQCTLQIITPIGVSSCIFVLDRARFTAVVNSCRKTPRSRGSAEDDGSDEEEDDDHHIDIEWDEWGPRCTRWLDADDLSTQYITTSAGQRMVAIAYNAFQQPAPIRVLDFNPAAVLAFDSADHSDGLHATRRVVPAGTQVLEPFADPLVSGDALRGGHIQASVRLWRSFGE
ncbi:hypothetical protein MSAN_00112900 [Mycena sanguinolenta]|uniref:F-box domain-containing protein n=1 Tax=Mycena sanguinolenta TaxID=230812 RepID=A0A8H6ZHG7_9AGAR|nr:hypothetical protein MSAN_00112900 [Mycena sanguinolenta]